jgi:hypothetical protein
MLAIFFGANEPATGIELTDHIVLRLNQQTKRAMSLLLLDFAILTERTEYGPRSYSRTTLHWRQEDIYVFCLRTARLKKLTCELRRRLTGARRIGKTNAFSPRSPGRTPPPATAASTRRWRRPQCPAVACPRGPQQGITRHGAVWTGG